MSRVCRTIATLGCAAALTAVTLAQGTAQKAKPTAQPPSVASQSAHVIVLPDKVQWGPGPAGLPAGGQAAILDGDPSKPGLFVIRAKLPDGYRVPPHWHPTDEHLTVLSGTLMVGMGAKTDDASMQSLGPGGYAKMPKRMNHYVRARGETIIQVTGMGPFAVTYVNPQDDPRKKTPSR